MKKTEPYRQIVVESFRLAGTAGHRGSVEIRPINGQFFPTSMLVECSRRMRDAALYPVGTKFQVWVRPKQKLNFRPHLYCYHGDPIVTVPSRRATP